MAHQAAILLSVVSVVFFLFTVLRSARKFLPPLAPPRPVIRSSPNPSNTVSAQAASTASTTWFVPGSSGDPFVNGNLNPNTNNPVPGLGGSHPNATSQAAQITIGPVRHGTKNFQDAMSILQNGWLVGNGSANGSGVYLTTDLNTARSYAGSNGAVLTGNIRIRSDELIDYNTLINMPGCPKSGDGLTSYALSRGYKVVQNGNVYVALAPRSRYYNRLPHVVLTGIM